MKPSTLLMSALLAGFGLSLSGCGSSGGASDTEYWKKWKKKKPTPAAVAPLTAEQPASAPPPAATKLPFDTEDALVNRCHDGDTCVLTKSDGTTITIRLAGIDAPEVMGGEDGKGQPLGIDARDLLISLVRGKHVQLREIEKDPYGRTVGEFYLGNQLQNIKLVQAGLAEAYKYATNAVDKRAYAAAEAAARNAKKGVWAQDSYESPSDFRKANKAAGGEN